jgi:hypothetical protein
MRHFAVTLTILSTSVAAAAAPAAVAAPAQGAGEARTVVVASGPGGAPLTLAAQDGPGRGLCLDVGYAGTTTPDALCPAPSRSRSGDLAGPRVLAQGATTVLFGTVTAATRRVDLAFSSGRTVKAATYAGRAYTGRAAGDVRFYAVAVEGAPALGAVTLRGRGGRTRGTRDLDALALPPLGGRWIPRALPDELDRPSDVVVLGARIARPTRKRPGRRVAALCAGLRTAGVPSRAVCVTRRTRIDLRFAANCDTGRSIVYGVAPALVRSATAVLASGARRPVAVLRTPAGVRRRGSVVIGEIPDGQPRRVELFDAKGTRVATSALSGGAC